MRRSAAHLDLESDEALVRAAHAKLGRLGDDRGVGLCRLNQLLEAPGARATGQTGPRARARGSGFVSVDNNDRTAETTWRLFQELGVNRSRDIVIWNIVPWYVGDERHVRPVLKREIEEARPALLRLLELLTELRIVVLLGGKALRGWLQAQIPYPVLDAPHTSPLSLAGHPERRALIQKALQTALHEAATRPPYRLSAFEP